MSTADLPTNRTISNLTPNETYVISVIPKRNNDTGPTTNKSATTGKCSILS